MESLTTTGLLALMPENKEQRKVFAQDVINRITDGTMEQHEVQRLMIILKSGIDTLQMVYDNPEVKETAIMSLGGEKADFETGLMEMVKSRKFSYDHDSVWVDLNRQEKDIAAKRKQREAMLKALTEAVADPTTGEMIEPAVIQEVNHILKITLK